ncbi:MAG: phenylalanine--tRNA ligase subunit beta, partial [Myxococcota bacterium]
MRLPLAWLAEFVELPAEAELCEALELAGFEDAYTEDAGGERVLELGLTPNRGDAASLLGLARELRALFGSELTLPPCEA